MNDWRTARSLLQLLSQANAVWPDRSRTADGTIGDAEHAARDSDHNPWYGPGIVTALDITHDPTHGADMNQLAAALVASRDRRVKYVIFNRRICDSRPEYGGWTWKPYTGDSPHTEHLHLSVVASPLCDDVTPWAMPAEEDDMFEAPDRTKLGHVDDMLAKSNVPGKVVALTADMVEVKATLARIEAALAALTPAAG